MIMHRAWKEKVLPFKLIEKLETLKAQGKIRFSGFSFHDNLTLFKRADMRTIPGGSLPASRS